MNQIMIDGNIVKTEKDFHRTLAIQCDVAEFYGHNLNALWDLLSWGVERPVCIIWNNSANSKKFMGASAFYQIINVLQRVKEQDESFGWVDRFDYIIKQHGRSQNADAAIALLEAGADPNIPNRDNVIPLAMIGMIPKRLDVLELMLKKGGNVHFYNGHYEVLQLLELFWSHDKDYIPVIEMMKQYA